MTLKIPLYLLCLFSTLHLYGQERCGTVPYMKSLRQQNNLLEQPDQFEQWLHGKLKNHISLFHTQSQPYKIPVVVHIIHKGESEGVGTNISTAQVLSQINVLNKDFKRLNTDASNTPAEFIPVAGSLDIEFVLAKRDPEGFPSDGIVRVQGSQNLWSVNDNYQLKSQSYWPAEEYMNIWVADLAGDYLGYAQFPVSSLPGLENSSINRLTDGVVIDYRVFGSIDDGPFNLDSNYNRGRSTTHEVGHFFGLRHIWGDAEGEATCSGTDYVDDTPTQERKTSGCPSHPRSSCSSTDMFQNFMDYTNDNCMNIFTQGQALRMSTVIENSPRRLSLLTSPALEDPVPSENDLGISVIISPLTLECDNTVTPVIEVKNYGTNNITSAQIRMLVNGATVQTRTVSLNLEPLETAVVDFNSYALITMPSTFRFEILQTNGVADENPFNNIRSIATSVPENITLPFFEEFNALPAAWSIHNPDGLFTWELKTAPKESPSNKALFINFYDYEDNLGEIDLITTPVFDLSNADVAYLTFDVAYAQFQGSVDGLRVYVITDCNPDIYEGNLIFSKQGFALQTAGSSASRFTPSSQSQWRNELVDLSPFTGMSNIQLAFVGVNDWGNNLYIDNIRVVNYADEDLVLKAVIDPQPVRCENEITPKLLVQNVGMVTINSFRASYLLNDVTYSMWIEQILAPSQEIEIELVTAQLQDGRNTLTFSITEPNGIVDANPEDNTQNMQVIVNKSVDRIPLRENFNTGIPESWAMINPNYGSSWEEVQTNYNGSVYFNAFENMLTGDEAWLLSPVLDLSSAEKASMFFDVSHAGRDGRHEQLLIVASTNCGLSYDNLVFNSSDDPLTDITASSPWIPAAGHDWQKMFINLNDLAGKENVRFAFIVVNEGGNNLYLDNIEFYTSDDPNPKVIDTPYAIYGSHPFDAGDFYITFNLEARQSVNYQVIDSMGRLIAEAELSDVLNQTFLVDAGHSRTGVYIIRLKIGKQYYASKVFLSR